MSDLIKREDAIRKIVGLNMQVYEGNACVGARTYLTKEEIIYAIDELPSAEPEQKWIPCSERLPQNGQRVIGYGGRIVIVTFEEGISQETREKMERGEIENPTEKVWCLSDSWEETPRSKLYRRSDEWGNNKVPYCWDDSPMLYFGQDIIAWMPLPEPWRGEE